MYARTVRAVRSLLSPQVPDHDVVWCNGSVQYLTLMQSSHCCSQLTGEVEGYAVKDSRAS